MSNCRQQALFACGVVAALAAAGDAGAARSDAGDHPGKPVIVEVPPHLAERACSFKHLACAHATDGGTALSILDSLERAWDSGVVLGVPLPTTAYDTFAFSVPSRSAISDRDGLSHFDHANSFSIVDARLPIGCARDFEVARELYAASALARSPAIDEGSLRAESTSLARLAVPCASIDASAFQSHPERVIVDALAFPSYDDGASSFFSFIDDAFAKQPGHAITASFALAPTMSAANATEWASEPNVFTVLRESMKDAMFATSSLDDVLLSFAVARATTMNPPARIEWDVAWPTDARTLASSVGIGPTGAAFVRIDTKGRAAGKRLRVDASWEQLAKIRWSIVKLDASGHEVSRIAMTSAPKATDAHVQVVDLDDASAVLVVATNVGPWKAPFDPDDVVWEPHGWLLTIAAE